MTEPVLTRRRLPNRREHELIEFEHAGIRYTAGAGRFEDGDLAEIFLHTRGKALPLTWPRVTPRWLPPSYSSTGVTSTPYAKR